jgi:hypothetical protein
VHYGLETRKRPLKERSKVPTKPVAFKARDVARAVKAAKLGDFGPVSMIEIDPPHRVHSDLQRQDGRGQAGE